jgi:flagellar P-ring protein precursor FlgI
MLRWMRFLLGVWLVWGTASAAAVEHAVRIGDLARLATVKDNAIVGYGIVTGLAGTGDSARNAATLQSVRNMLLRFGVNVQTDKLRARNSAAVMVTATLPPYSESGDKLDVNVTSMGDARSLVGGTLVLTPLSMADRHIYAMAQGPVSVGGFRYDLNGNLVQKNHPTAAHIPNGASVVRDVAPAIVDPSGAVLYKLYEPNFETANRIVDALNAVLGDGVARAKDAARVEVFVPAEKQTDFVRFLSLVEKTEVVPNTPARVVVNERTGMVVSGGSVVVSPVTVTHGNLSVSINTKFGVSQPVIIGNGVIGGGLSNVRTQVVPDTTVEVTEAPSVSVTLPRGSKVEDLVTALNKVKASSRDVITILQGIKRAGALHAQLVIQ